MKRIAPAATIAAVWKLEGTKLTLARVRDACSGRPLILNKRVFTRVS